MDTKGRMADADYVPAKYRGLDRFEARKQIVADIEAIGLLAQVEDKKIMQPFGDRSGVVIEPMLTEQWYVNAAELAKPAITAVETGKTKFTPEEFRQHVFPLDAQHPALVRVAPALVGPPDSRRGMACGYMRIRPKFGKRLSSPKVKKKRLEWRWRILVTAN